MRRLAAWPPFAMARRLRGDERGVVFAEFALVVPVFVILLLLGFEVSRFALLQQKLSQAGITLGDLVSQANALSADEVDDFMFAVEHVVAPFDLSQQGVVIVTAVVGDGTGQGRVSWQISGAGGNPAQSTVGGVDDVAALPDGFTLEDGETLIVSEVFYEFEPLFLTGLMAPRPLAHRAFFRPRFGALETLQS